MFLSLDELNYSPKYMNGGGFREISYTNIRYMAIGIGIITLLFILFYVFGFSETKISEKKSASCNSCSNKKNKKEEIDNLILKYKSENFDSVFNKNI